MGEETRDSLPRRQGETAGVPEYVPATGANRIVRTDLGNARNFACAYHGWTFSNEGELEYLPGEEEAYYSELDRECLRLVEARVETYAGIVFCGRGDHAAPSLDDFSGGRPVVAGHQFQPAGQRHGGIGPHQVD